MNSGHQRTADAYQDGSADTRSRRSDTMSKARYQVIPKLRARVRLSSPAPLKAPGQRQGAFLLSRPLKEWHALRVPQVAQIDPQPKGQVASRSQRDN